jgi:hypothetical protein
MMTSLQCLAKADELDVIGFECDTAHGRETYAILAIGWRRNAVMARHQEAHAQAWRIGRP